jgi:BON domain-containing protein
MTRNYDSSRKRGYPSSPDDDGWYDRWIDSISDDVAAGMAGEPERDARLQDLRDGLNRMRRRFQPRRFGHRGHGPRGYVRSDERIREEVNECLTADPYVDATEIEVSVAEGVVTLNGTVENRAEKRLAEDCVDTVPGVRDVNNNLSIRQSARAPRREPPGPGWGRTAI